LTIHQDIFMAMQQEQTVLTSQSVQAMHRTAEVMDEYRKRLKLCSERRDCNVL
jgi:hypothetical protein